jgi:dihydroneopterin aldolase
MTTAGAGRDHLLINGLRLVGTHGALPEERERPQPFEIDLDLLMDMRLPGRSDDLSDTIDYGEVVRNVATVVAGQQFLLLEALAEAVASAVLAQRGLDGVTVTVRKLRPPVPFDMSWAGVTITRLRSAST